MIEKCLHRGHLNSRLRHKSSSVNPNFHAVYIAILSAIIAFPAIAANNDFIVYTGQEGSIAGNSYDNTLDADISIADGNTLNIVGRTVKNTISDTDTSLEGVFNTFAIKNFDNHTLEVGSGANLFVQGGTTFYITLQYVDEKGEQASHEIPAKGIYGLSVGNGKIINNGEMTVTSGYCDYTNGIENLATAGTKAEIVNNARLTLLGGGGK